MLGGFFFTPSLRIFLVKRVQTIFAISYNTCILFFIIDRIASIIQVTIRRIRTYSHQFLLSDHSLFDVLGRVEPLTVISVSRGHENGPILTHLVGQLRPRTLRITVVIRVSAPLIVRAQVFVLLNEQFLKGFIFELTCFDLVGNFVFKCVAVL